MKNINKILSTLSLSASDTREDTIRSIIKTTLLESRTSCPIAELKENIIINYDIQLYDSEFNFIINKLIENNEITGANSQYSLTQQERQNLLDTEGQLKSNELIRYQNFKNFIEEKSNHKIAGDDIKLLWTTFKNYLYNCFYQYGIKAIEFLHPKYTKKENEIIHNGEGLQEAFRALKKPDLIEIFKLVVENYSDYATKEDLDFIDELGQKTLSFASLGLSPEQAKEDLVKELIDWVLYLDTNFLFSVLGLHSNSENEACKELLKLVMLNKDIIKIKFRYSELTLKELRHKKSDFKNLDGALTDSAIRALLKSDIDEFSRKYYTDLLANREDTMHPSQIIDLAEITLPKLNVEISRNHKQIEALGEDFINARISDYQNYIDNLNVYRSEYFKGKNIGQYKEHYRSDPQKRHDIVLREMILNSRKLFKKDEVQTFNEVKYFGVTLDGLLVKYDNFLINKNESTVYPTFFKPSFLLNKLVRLLPIKTPDYKKAFIKAVSSKGFHRESQRSDDILKIVSYLRKAGIDNENVLLNLISEKLFLEKFYNESIKEGFDEQKFFESELNKILAEREKEISESRIHLEKLSEYSQIQQEEKQEAVGKQKEQEEQLILLTRAVKDLKTKVKKIEKAPATILNAPQINFEAAEKQQEIDALTAKVKEEKERNNKLENEIRETKRNKYFKREKFKWRCKTFLYILICLIFPIGVLIYCGYISGWEMDSVGEMIQTNKQNFIFTSVIWLFSVVLSSFFIKRFSDQFNQSAINAFISNLEKNLPDELKEIK